MSLLTSVPTGNRPWRSRAVVVKTIETQVMNLESKPKDRTFYLPRLPREYYMGDSAVFWTLTIIDRSQGWLDERFHFQFRDLLFHTVVREGLVCPVYCLMPDHIHLIWMGLRMDSDQLKGMSFLRTYLEPMLGCAKFQHQAHDEVLRTKQREREAFRQTCYYIAENPVRAELVKRREEWIYTGCLVPVYPTLNPLADDYWTKFWRIMVKIVEPDAGNIKRPPIGETMFVSGRSRREDAG